MLLTKEHFLLALANHVILNISRALFTLSAIPTCQTAVSVPTPVAARTARGPERRAEHACLE
jgi:hypothetical protein